MIRRTWDEIASSVGIVRCRGRLPSGQYCHEEHGRGGVATDGIVHWSDSHPRTTGNVRRFMVLAALALEPDLRDQPDWVRIYLTNLRVQQLGHVAGVAVSTPWLDRLRVRSLIEGEPPSPLRDAAREWSKG